MREFCPEGGLYGTASNKSALSSLQGIKEAMARGQILEARVTLCDKEHNLHVDLGVMKGIIPRSEGAIGIREGYVRDIALISRVGKYVCFIIDEIRRGEDGKMYAVLSRRRAQKRAVEEFSDKLCIGDIIEAKVTHMESFGAFCDIGAGLTALLPIEAISVSRIPHPSARFFAGQTIRCTVAGRDNLGRITLSHKELLGTWEENVAAFSVGMTVPGVVRGIKDYGTFVELTPNLSGLAEPREPLSEGERVSVFIKSILPERMKIKLLVIGRLPADPTPAPLQYYLPEGRLERWQYAPPGCAKVGSVSVFTP